MRNTLAVLIVAVLLSACTGPVDRELADHLEAEQDFHANQQYLEDVYNREAFRPEVYANEEFLSDCEEYQMMECYK